MVITKSNTAYILFTILMSLLSVASASEGGLFNSFIEVDEKSIRNGNQIQGRMNINGENYNAICDCSPVSPDSANSNTQNQLGPKCDPSMLKIHTEKSGQGASQDDIRNLVGNIEELNYVQVPSSYFKCLDGRNTDAVLSTPGGDAGEFVLALIVYEDLLGGGKRLTQDNVDTIFSQYLKMMPHPKFYMCTDDISISHLERQLSVEGLNIQNPKSQIIPDLVKLIDQPENIGDLHLKMMIKYPEQFAIRKEIVSMFINSFYKLLWNKDDELSRKLELEVLIGEHRESAFVEVRSEHACQAQQLAPLLKTKNKVISVFINHLDAASIRRALLANFFSKNINLHMDPVDPVKMHNRLNHHGYISLDITGSYVAKNLPFYTINLA